MKMFQNSLAHETRSGEGIIFLDLQSDQYSCCYQTDSLVGEYFSLSSEKDLNPPLPASSIALNDWSASSQHVSASASLKDVTRFIIALFRAAVQFRGKTVRELCGIVESFGQTRLPSHIPIEDVARLFGQFMTILPLQPQCLFRSFFLLHFLDRYGHRADWIFGVHLFPFRAHCWIVSENQILDEALHAIEDYQVILVARQIGR